MRVETIKRLLPILLMILVLLALVLYGGGDGGPAGAAFCLLDAWEICRLA